MFSLGVWRNEAGEIEAEGLYLPKLAHKEYGTPEPIQKADAGELLDMLPKRNETLTTEEIAELEVLMGQGGVFEIMPQE